MVERAKGEAVAVRRWWKRRRETKREDKRGKALAAIDLFECAFDVVWVAATILGELDS